MANLGLDILDRTVQDTNRWLNQIGATLETEDKQRAYHALRSVLAALRDRVTPDLSAALAAQLPLLVRGIFYEGYDPSRTPQTYRTLDGWNEAVTQLYAADDVPDAERLTRTVFGVLNEHLGRGVIEKVFTALPDDVRALWPHVQEEVAHTD